jgi:hypothetical protein
MCCWVEWLTRRGFPEFVRSWCRWRGSLSVSESGREQGQQAAALLSEHCLDSEHREPLAWLATTARRKALDVRPGSTTMASPSRWNTRIAASGIPR